MGSVFFHFLFTVCVFHFVLADIAPVHKFWAYQQGRYGDKPHQEYKSSDIVSPIFEVNSYEHDLVDRSLNAIFLTLRYNGAKGAGPYLFSSDDLSLIYADPRHSSSMNARVQTLHGEDYLTFFAGTHAGAAHAQGHCLFLNNKYEIKYSVTTHNISVLADGHECEVTPDGTVLLTAYEPHPHDLHEMKNGKQDDLLADSVFQEVDVVTGEVRFSWRASDHFSPGLSYGACNPAAGANGCDAYHINSLQKTQEGHYLVSLRKLKMLTYINGTSGEPIWSLGGPLNDFQDLSQGHATSFGYQHHGRFTDDSLTQVTMFDNHELDTLVGCDGSSCSRGRHLELDYANMTAKLVHDYYSPEGLDSMPMGSYQTLDSGNVFLGWGVNGAFTEYKADGSVAMDVQFCPLAIAEHADAPLGVSSYRAFKQAWKAYPTWDPSVWADRSNGTLYVSWNGATEVRYWAVHGAYEADAFDGASLGREDAIQIVVKDGFETMIQLVDTAPSFIKVAALDADGKTLRATETVEMVHIKGRHVDKVIPRYMPRQAG